MKLLPVVAEEMLIQNKAAF